MTSKMNIALMYGGNSSERDISLMSGKNVGECLSSLGHNVSYIDTKYKKDLESLVNNSFDIAFICLHGKGGEDGSVQGLLETLSLPYTGSKILASARAINKAEAKEIYDKQGISNAQYFSLKQAEEYNLDFLLEITGDDVVVKAASEGSSIGLYFAFGKEQIKEAINKSFEFDDTVLVEKNIKGREFTVAVLEFPKSEIENYQEKIKFDGNAAALPVIEIIPKNEFYDFASKYDEGGSKHVCPAEIDKKLAQTLQEAAVRAHKALGCSGFSRTDFRVDLDNNIFALETNTIPGMTKTSLVPDAARAIGISFEKLCEIIICYSLEK